MGDKLWEGNAQLISSILKEATENGLSMIMTWMLQLKGTGKANGVDGVIVFTTMGTINPDGMGTFVGKGGLRTMNGEMVAIKGSGYSKSEAEKGKGTSILTFRTISQKLAWLNTTAAIEIIEGDPMFQQADITIYEWK